MTDRGAPGAVSDGALARRVRSGPADRTTEEESELYRRFASRVRFYGLRHLGDESAAQDLAQEVLLVTIEQQGREGPGSGPDRFVHPGDVADVGDRAAPADAADGTPAERLSSAVRLTGQALHAWMALLQPGAIALE